MREAGVEPCFTRTSLSEALDPRGSNFAPSSLVLGLSYSLAYSHCRGSLARQPPADVFSRPEEEEQRLEIEEGRIKSFKTRHHAYNTCPHSPVVRKKFSKTPIVRDRRLVNGKFQASRPSTVITRPSTANRLPIYLFLWLPSACVPPWPDSCSSVPALPSHRLDAHLLVMSCSQQWSPVFDLITSRGVHLLETLYSPVPLLLTGARHQHTAPTSSTSSSNEKRVNHGAPTPSFSLPPSFPERTWMQPLAPCGLAEQGALPGGRARRI